MHLIPEKPNLSFLAVIFYLLIIISGSSASLRAQETFSKVDTVLDVTKAARIIVSDLLIEEEVQRQLIDSLIYQNMQDSLTIIQMLRIQNEQKIRLLSLSEEIEMTRKSHEDLVYEIEKIKPAYTDIVIPTAGGVLGAMLVDGESAEKAAKV